MYTINMAAPLNSRVKVRTAFLIKRLLLCCFQFIPQTCHLSGHIYSNLTFHMSVIEQYVDKMGPFVSNLGQVQAQAPDFFFGLPNIFPVACICKFET